MKQETIIKGCHEWQTNTKKDSFWVYNPEGREVPGDLKDVVVWEGPETSDEFLASIDLMIGDIDKFWLMSKAYRIPLVSSWTEVKEKAESVLVPFRKTWYTSDTHFGDLTEIVSRRRPFESVTENSLTIVRLWNTLVGPEDVVYHLGGLGNPETMKLLNGHIKFLPGTYYDTQRVGELEELGIEILPEAVYGYTRESQVRLGYYPPEKPEKALVIHGGGVLGRPGRISVSQDLHHFRPISAEDIDWLKRRGER